MLVIDNKYLNKMEDYGFTRHKFNKKICYKKIFKHENKEDYDKDIEISLLVNPTNKKTENEIVGYIDTYDNEIDETFDLDLIYDLIKDGVIKKVGE